MIPAIFLSRSADTLSKAQLAPFQKLHWFPAVQAGCSSQDKKLRTPKTRLKTSRNFPARLIAAPKTELSIESAALIAFVI